MRYGTTIVAAAILLVANVGRADVFLMGSGLTSLTFVTVGNPGNAGQLSGIPGLSRICGAVNYTFSMGKYDVTAGQYTAFLNAVAKTDTYGLYSTSMDTAVNSYGCNIKRSGLPGSYTYSVASDWANRPANFVSWGDAARFANWLTNGQPTGTENVTTTEDGSYYLNGTTNDTALLAVTRKANAKYVIPTEDEWYKAAYYDPLLNGGMGGYWTYPTKSNSPPSNVLSSTATDNANYYDLWKVGNGTYTIGAPYYRTEVGAFADSSSFYGTFDQGGNVWEYNESILSGTDRGLRGGSFACDHGYLTSGARWTDYYIGLNTPVDGSVGFRVSAVPEPATLSLLALGGLAVLKRRRASRG